MYVAKRTEFQLWLSEETTYNIANASSALPTESRTIPVGTTHGFPLDGQHLLFVFDRDRASVAGTR